MLVLSGVYYFSIMDLDPRGHDSSLRDKNQDLGANLAKFTCATRSFIFAIGSSVFVRGSFVLEITH